MARPLSNNYRNLFAECEGRFPNQIDARNELAAIYPRIRRPHRWLSHALTYDDVVHVIASVWLGLRQIKYPFTISFGTPEFFQSIAKGNTSQHFLPPEADAVIFPLEIAAKAQPGKRKLASENQGTTAEAPERRKRRNTKRSLAVALATCEPEDHRLDKFRVDLRSVGTDNDSRALQQELTKICDTVGDVLHAARWQSPRTINFSAREVVKPLAPIGREAHHAILHAWAYMLDLPIHGDHQMKPDDFYDELIKLFNLSLSGSLTFKLLQMFLEESGYGYAKVDAIHYQCMPQEKYRRQLRNFCSVELREGKDTDWSVKSDEVFRRLAHESLYVPSGRYLHLKDEVWDVTSVRNAIGVLWRATFEKSFGAIPTQTLAFSDGSNAVYPAAASGQTLLMVHCVSTSKHQIKSKSARFFVLSTALIRSQRQVEFTHYGYDPKVQGSEIESAAERTVRNCGWHTSIDVDKVAFTHKKHPSPIAPTTKTSALYAVMFAWCLILRIGIFPGRIRQGSDGNDSDDGDSDSEEDDEEDCCFSKGCDLVNAACAGIATAESIEAFAYAYGFATLLHNPSEDFTDDTSRLTSTQSTTGDDLGNFIRSKRKLSKEIIVPDPPSTPQTPKSHSKTTLGSSLTPTEKGVSTDPADPPKSSSPLRFSTTESSQDPEALAESKRDVKSSDDPEYGQQLLTAPAATAVAGAQAPSQAAPSQAAPSQAAPSQAAPSQATQPSSGPESSNHQDPNSFTVLGPRKDASRFEMYDTSQCSSQSWMDEFKKHLNLCKQRRDARKEHDQNLNIAKFSSQHSDQNSLGTDIYAIGDAIAPLWEALGRKTIKYGIYDIDMVNNLSRPDFARQGMDGAAGGPNKETPLLMPMFSSMPRILRRKGVVQRSPDPGTTDTSKGMGHLWFAAAVLHKHDPPPPALPEGQWPSQEHSVPEKDQTPDIVIHAWDSVPQGDLAYTKHFETKMQNIVRLCGWIPGSQWKKNEYNLVEIFPKYCNPVNIQVIWEPCPDQTHESLQSLKGTGNKRKGSKPDFRNTCGLLTILNAWRFMLELPPAAKVRHGILSAGLFWKHAFELFDLAMIGCLSSRTIQAFLNAYGYLEQIQNLDATVIDVWTVDNDVWRLLVHDLCLETATP